LTNVIFENNASVYADGARPSLDPDGASTWYYKNAGGGEKINWYFFDGQAVEASLGDFNIYAKVKIYNTSSVPLFMIYTFPTGQGDAASWYKSRVAYFLGPNLVEKDKTYLLYTGEPPPSGIEPDLERIKLSKSTSSTVGTQNPSERVLTASFGTNSTIPQGSFEASLYSITYFSSQSSTIVNFRTADRYAEELSGSSNVILVDIEESKSSGAIQRGLTTPGWNTYTTYVDTNGVVRHKSECIVAFSKTKEEAGDNPNDDSIVG